MGVIGKTDRVDARMLAELGTRLTPARTTPLSAVRRALQAEATRRRQLVEMRKQEATRLQQTADAIARRDICSVIATLDRHIRRIELHMARLVAADNQLAAINRRLQTAPGVGPIVSATLIAELPELGQIDRRSIAALAGLAPIARDSRSCNLITVAEKPGAVHFVIGLLWVIASITGRIRTQHGN
jgi:transposase